MLPLSKLFLQILKVIHGKYATVDYAVVNYGTDGLFVSISYTIHIAVPLEIVMKVPVCHTLIQTLED